MCVLLASVPRLRCALLANMLRESHKRNSLENMVDLHMIPVSQGHTYALWVWANDAATRRASGDRDLIPWGEHVDWLQSLNGTVDHQVATDRDSGQPLGVIRLDFSDDKTEARLSYCVAPEARGQHVGTQLVQWAMDTHANEAVLLAEVESANAVSHRIFQGLGWYWHVGLNLYIWPPRVDVENVV